LSDDDRRKFGSAVAVRACRHRVSRLQRDREVGQQISRLRKAAGLTQEGLAGRLGVSQQQVGKYERGENRLSHTRLDGNSSYLLTDGGWSTAGSPKRLQSFRQHV
jgi:DNA-binding XRE family transcriptional regulator